MGLMSIFKRRDDAGSNDAAGAPADAVQRARTRARQRLIGAAVLVVIGIVGFPLVFETQPRSIPVDIPIEVPRKEAAPPLAMPAGRSLGTSSAAASMPAAAAMPAAPGGVITESRSEAGRELVASAPAQRVEPVVRAASKPAAAGPDEAGKPAPDPRAAEAVADASRAKALLEGKPAAREEAGGRFVVQVGAFADPNAARETRVKVEKLGMKTYTQVASTSAGDRIRVRVGPFGSRDEADKALAKARAAGFDAVVLTL